MPGYPCCCIPRGDTVTCEGVALPKCWQVTINGVVHIGHGDPDWEDACLNRCLEINGTYLLEPSPAGSSETCFFENRPNIFLCEALVISGGVLARLRRHICVVSLSFGVVTEDPTMMEVIGSVTEVETNGADTHCDDGTIVSSLQAFWGFENFPISQIKSTGGTLSFAGGDTQTCHADAFAGSTFTFAPAACA